MHRTPSPCRPPPQLLAGEEAETLRWLHSEVRDRGTVPLVEAEAIVRSLSVAMHGGSQVMLPLLQLKEFDQYTTTHSMNVAVLTMALAEYMGLAPSDVRAFGIAGLLHDVGKVRIPIEVLTKPGKLTPEERALMNQHPADGAPHHSRDHQPLDLAAIVAYEHHIMINGGGYPTLRSPGTAITPANWCTSAMCSTPAHPPPTARRGRWRKS